MNKRLREGWGFISPYHYLITLTAQDDESSDKQLVVVAVLIQDSAGTVSRMMAE